MNKLIIREATLEDVEAIYKLNKTELGYDYSIESTEENMHRLIASDTDKIYVALLDNKVVGYIHSNDYNLIYAPHMKNIMGIAVSSQYKRMGIGHALLMEVEKWAMQTDAKGVRLVSGETRANAHLFYQNCSYTEDKK